MEDKGKESKCKQCINISRRWMSETFQMFFFCFLLPEKKPEQSTPNNNDNSSSIREKGETYCGLVLFMIIVLAYTPFTCDTLGKYLRVVERCADKFHNFQF